MLVVRMYNNMVIHKNKIQKYLGTPEETTRSNKIF